MPGIVSLLTSILPVLLLATSTVNAGALERLFAPSAELWSFWEVHGNNADTIDHTPWQKFLKSNVHTGDDGINRIDYAKVSQNERSVLRDYIDYLEDIKIRDYSRKEQLAYWINLYNAATVHLVLEHYPVASIQDIDISPGFLAFGPWGRKLLQIEGQSVSLNDIEHRILRPIWQDPRLHYGLNCASLGCPNLLTTAFTASNTQMLLEEGARSYVNHPRGVTIAGGELRVASIYSWFREDFGDSEADVIRHLRQYASTALSTALADFDSIDDDDYDWTLNDTNPLDANPVTDEDFE